MTTKSSDDIQEITTNNENENEPNLSGDEKIEKKVKMRVKNLHDNLNKVQTENESLKDRIAKLEEIAAMKANVEPSVNNDSEPPMQQNPEVHSGLTPEALNKMVEEKMTSFQNQTAVDNAHKNSQKLIEQMKNEDPEFNKLSQNDNKLGIPAEVVVHINHAVGNNDPKMAKRLFKELLSNQGMNDKMQLALLADKNEQLLHYAQTGKLANPSDLSGHYDKWLTNLLSKKRDNNKIDSPIPELSNEEDISDDDENDQKLKDYISG